MRTLAILAAGACCAAAPAAAQTAQAWSGDAMAMSRDGEVMLHGTGGVQTATCERGSATVSGSSNRATITGACEHLIVGGSDNEVRVQLASGARIHVGGSRNRVLWSVARGGRAPEVVRGGEGAVVEQAR